MHAQFLETMIVRVVAGCAGVAAASACPLAATTYVPISDRALADSTPLIVEVQVVGSEPSPDGVRISTDYTVEVDRVLKGEPGSSTIVVRVPGGEQPSGISMRVFGAPAFEDGERVLLFLRPTKQGPYAVEQLMLGAFHRVQAGSAAVWVRDLSEAHRLDASPVAERLRDAERFSDWLAARAQGMRAPQNYDWKSASSGELRSLGESFRLRRGFRAPQRWFAFDEGREVRWWTSSRGLGLPGGGHTEFQHALSAWNDPPDTNVSYAYAGQTAVSGGGSNYYGSQDGLNTVIFGDSRLGSVFDCGIGGLVSASYVYSTYDRRTFQGKRFEVIQEADIGTRTGIFCLFRGDAARARKLAEELFGHELGHTLGLDDSRSRGALMYRRLHADGRGARLTEDDREGLRQLYGHSGESTDARVLLPHRSLHQSRAVGPGGHP